MQIDRPIIIALILFVTLLLVYFLVMPEYNTFKSLQVELGEKKAEYNAEYDYYAAIDVTYFGLQDRADDIKKIDNALPETPELGRTIYYLQKTATDNNLIVKNLFLSKSSQSVSPSGNINNSNVKDIIFSMNLLGEYPALGEFIMSLEKSSRLFEITDISFSSPSGPPYNFSLQIKTHSY